MNGTWHFYVDDYKFNAVWADPSKIHAGKVITAVEPNWSILDQTPYPVALYRVYQKRWIGRYLQEQGVKVIVDLNVPANYAELNLEGVPDGWRSFATRAADAHLDDLVAHFAIAKRFHEEPIFLVVGGGKKVAEFCTTNGCVHVKGDTNGEG
jgi:hypothetical protein